MIEAKCTCGAWDQYAESEAGQRLQCRKCEAVLALASAEALPDGAGVGDFDGRLVVRSGPDRVGEQILLGGVPDIEVGKLDGKHVQLISARVSRNHCRFSRLDFGPSRWKIVDNQSKNGIFANGARVQEHELVPGDCITIGDYELEYASTFHESPPLPAVPVGPKCPSCEKTLKLNAKICVDCGIHVATGKTLVTSKGLDENTLAVRADTWLRLISWVVPFGLVPVASEAFGTQKPRATMSITGITIIASVIFYIAMLNAPRDKSVLNWMLWTGSEAVPNKLVLSLKSLHQLPPGAPAARLNKTPAPKPAADDDDASDDETGAPPSSAGRDREIQRLIDQIVNRPVGEFHFYQLFTHAFLHAGLMHLAGNLLFLLVFGLRVNELIGNIKTAIVYPVLILAAGGTQMWAMSNRPPQSCLGASGAIMGLAGMYFIFFPVQKVHMAIWLRLGIFTGWRLLYKVFTMRGFWLLVLWVGFNDVLPVALGSHDGTAHWAHLGGFVSGMLVALGLLLTRQVNGRGADLLSVTLGKRAWAILGKPTQWRDDLPASILAERNVSMSYR